MTISTEPSLLQYILIYRIKANITKLEMKQQNPKKLLMVSVAEHMMHKKLNKLSSPWGSWGGEKIMYIWIKAHNFELSPFHLMLVSFEFFIVLLRYPGKQNFKWVYLLAGSFENVYKVNRIQILINEIILTRISANWNFQIKNSYLKCPKIAKVTQSEFELESKLSHLLSNTYLVAL